MISICTILLSTLGLAYAIFNGVDTFIETASSVVSVRVYGVHSCGGSIISSEEILTSAMCVQNIKPSEVSIQYGLTVIGAPQNIINAKRITIHPRYDVMSKYNDVAVISLKSPIPLGPKAKVIQLATADAIPGSSATVAGWGRVLEGGSMSAHLKKADVNIVDRLVCQQQYETVPISELMMCAADKTKAASSCEGDFGGPLIGGGVQVGISSWSYGCGVPNYSGVFTNVAPLRSWIIETMQMGGAVADHEGHVENEEKATTLQYEN